MSDGRPLKINEKINFEPTVSAATEDILTVFIYLFFLLFCFLMGPEKNQARKIPIVMIKGHFLLSSQLGFLRKTF